MIVKSFELKADEQVLDTGIFEGYASIFGNVDRVGDVVLAGAFKDTIRANNGYIKLQYNHKDTIGIATITEDEKGLKVKASVNLDVQKGREVLSLIKQGAISKMSFAYDVLEEVQAVVDGKQIFKLKELKIYEVSAVDFPANEAAEIMAVKSDRLRRCQSSVIDLTLNPLEGLQSYVSSLGGLKK